MNSPDALPMHLKGQKCILQCHPLHAALQQVLWKSVGGVTVWGEAPSLAPASAPHPQQYFSLLRTCWMLSEHSILFPSASELRELT